MKRKTMRMVGAAAALVLLAGIALAQDTPKRDDDRGERKKEDSDQELEGERLERKRAELERLIYGTDRDARVQAVLDAIKIAPALGEPFFFKLIDFAWPTADEREQMWAGAAEGICYAGASQTKRDIPYLRKLLDTPPTVLVKDERPDMRTTGQDVPKYDYQSKAALTYMSWIVQGVMAAIEDKIKGLPPRDQAKFLIDAGREPHDTLQKYFPPDLKDPRFDDAENWLGPDAKKRIQRIDQGEVAFAYADLIAAEKDPARRGRLCRLVCADVGGLVHVEKVRNDPRVRQGLAAAVRAVLKANPSDPNESLIFEIVRGFDLKEVDADLITFIPRAKDDSTDDDHRERRDSILIAATNALAYLGTDTGLDFLASSFGGPRPSADASIHPELFIPRYIAQLERERLTTERFSSLAGHIDSCWHWLAHKRRPRDFRALERILASARQGLANASAAEKPAIERNVAYLEKMMGLIREEIASAPKEKEESDKEENEGQGEKKGGDR